MVNIAPLSKLSREDLQIVSEIKYFLKKAGVSPLNYKLIIDENNNCYIANKERLLYESQNLEDIYDAIVNMKYEVQMDIG